MELEELRCKNCGAPIQEKDIYLELAMAKCSHCGTIFSLRGMELPPSLQPKPAPPPEPTPPPRRRLVPMPDKFHVFDKGETFQLTYRWFDLKFIFLLVFSVFWNGIVCVWYGAAFSTGLSPMMLFGLLHLAAGIGMGYYTLAGFLNSTTITAREGMLSIQHRPLPWPGSKQLSALDIKQLYCKEKVQRSDNGEQHTYQVYTILTNGSKEKLLSDLSKPEQALYIEQELERYLAIQDQPVPGELPR